jgi:hypothetical protein
MIAGVLEVKKEISVNGRLVFVDSLPAREESAWSCNRQAFVQEQSWAKIA